MSTKKVLKSVERPTAHINPDLMKDKADKFFKMAKGLLKVQEQAWTFLQNMSRLQISIFMVLNDICDDNWVSKCGVPAAHRIFGNTRSLQSCFYSYNMNLFKLITDLATVDGVSPEKIEEAIRIFLKYSLVIFEGQSLGYYYRDSQTCPSVDQYMEMIEKKTTGSVNLLIKICQLFSDVEKNYQPVMALVGTYIQVIKDKKKLLLENAKNKDFGEDLAEGKYTFPIVHAISTNEKDGKLINDVLKMRTRNPKILRAAVEHLHKLGSIEYTNKYLADIKEKIGVEFTKLGFDANRYLDMIDMATNM